MEQDQQEYSITMLGGDTTANLHGLSLTITAYGTVPTGSALTRSGAQVGDALYVSGTIGAGALGLLAAAGDTTQARWLPHYQLPEPHLALGQKLRGVATACMDISDGLVQDVGHLCAASGVGADITLAAIPLADPRQRERCLTGGDDYQLLFTAPADISIPEATRIGRITESNIRFLDENETEMHFSQTGYRHF